MKVLTLLIPVFTAVALGACGEGKDPLELFNQSSTFPALLLPVDQSTIGGNPIQPFSSSNDGLTLTMMVPAANLRAPAEGVVTRIEGEGTNYALTIRHTNQLSTRISQLTSLPIARVGQQVAKGEQVATVSLASSLKFSVFVNGAAVCPYGYLSSDDQRFVMSRSVAQGPCL